VESSTCVGISVTLYLAANALSCARSSSSSGISGCPASTSALWAFIAGSSTLVDLSVPWISSAPAYV